MENPCGNVYRVTTMITQKVRPAGKNGTCLPLESPLRSLRHVPFHVCAQLIWQVYAAVTDGDDRVKAKIVKVLGLEVPARELNHADPKTCLFGVSHGLQPQSLWRVPTAAVS